MSDEGLTNAFLEFRNGLKRIVQRFVDNPIDVEDIVHEAYVRSLVASRKQEIDSPKAFIARTARNLALNHISSAHANQSENTGDTDFPDNQLGDSSVEDRVEVERDLYAYCLAIEQLPIQCRRVFTLKQVYGLSQREIATRLKIDEKTVEYHVSKGLLRCRRFLQGVRTDGALPLDHAVRVFKREEKRP